MERAQGVRGRPRCEEGACPTKGRGARASGARLIFAWPAFAISRGEAPGRRVERSPVPVVRSNLGYSLHPTLSDGLHERPVVLQILVGVFDREFAHGVVEGRIRTQISG